MCLQVLHGHRAPTATAAVDHGLSLRIQCIVNFPGETPADLLEQAAFFRDVDEALANQGVPPRGLPQRLLANSFRLEPASDVFHQPDRHGVRIIDLPADGFPHVRHAAAVLKRWELRQPHDESLHLYLAAKLGFHRDPWAVSTADYRRFAAATHRLFRPELRLVQTPGTRVARDPASGRAMVEHLGERMPLNPAQFKELQRIAGGAALGQTALLAAELHARHILRLAPGTAD